MHHCERMLETAPTSLEINPSFVNRVRAHTPTREELEKVERLMKNQAGGAMVSADQARKVHKEYETNRVAHCNVEDNLSQIQEELKSITLNWNELRANPFVDNEALMEKRASLENEAKRLSESVGDTDAQLPRGLQAHAHSEE